MEALGRAYRRPEIVRRNLLLLHLEQVCQLQRRPLQQNRTTRRPG